MSSAVLNKPNTLAARLAADAYEQLAKSGRVRNANDIAPMPAGASNTANVEGLQSSAIDLLSQAIERVRPMLDRNLPLKARVRVLWAATKNARKFAASDVLATEFSQLARDSGLTADLNDPVRHLSGEETVRHVVSWACRGMNPFETGPLQ
jgi:hypothetical protein